MTRPTSNETKEGDVIRTFAMSLLAMRGATLISSGTCIIIGPYIAITALHVLHDYSNQFDGMDFDGTTKATFSLILVGNGEDNKPVLFEVKQVTCRPTVDIVLLSIVPASESAQNFHWTKLSMRVAPPTMGSFVSSFGFTENACSVEESATEIIFTPRALAPTVRGRVTELYIQGLGRGMRSGPRFQFNGKIVGGMSGGPVFSDDGKLVGVNSSSLLANSDDEEHASLVSLLFPMLTMTFTYPVKMPHGIPQSAYVYDLAFQGFVVFTDLASVKTTRNADGSGLEIEL